MNLNQAKEYYWDHVNMTKDCWIWTGWSRGGYGRFRINGKYVTAHRFAWEYANGRKIPKGKVVCHRCDIPLCVRGSHLWLGTVEQNNRDRARKGRSNTPFGSKNQNSKLTELEVRGIKALLSVGFSSYRISKLFNVHHTCIWHIAIGRTWKQISNESPNSITRKENQNAIEGN